MKKTWVRFGRRLTTEPFARRRPEYIAVVGIVAGVAKPMNYNYGFRPTGNFGSSYSNRT